MLHLRTFPDPILRQKAQEVTDFTDISDKVAQMIQIMRQHQGIGLAANQAGLLDRIFVMQLSADSEPQAFINPVVVEKSKEKFKYEEGCLSLPGINASVLRAKKITLQWVDETGQAHEKVFQDLASTCIQHEIDHLDGILFPDRTNPMAQQKLWKKLQSHLKKNNSST